MTLSIDSELIDWLHIFTSQVYNSCDLRAWRLEKARRRFRGKIDKKEVGPTRDPQPTTQMAW